MSASAAKPEKQDKRDMKKDRCVSVHGYVLFVYVCIVRVHICVCTRNALQLLLQPNLFAPWTINNRHCLGGF